MSSSGKNKFEKNEVADYEKRRYHGLDQKIVHGREVRILKKYLREIRSGLPAGSPALLLDAPSGYGRFSDLILGFGFRLVSSDLSFHMVERAVGRTGTPPAALGAASDLTKGLPFKSGVFSAVFSMRLFHHLHGREDRRAVLREFGRVAAGWAIVSYYQTNVFHDIQRRLRRTIKPNKRKIKMIPRPEFLEDARDAGFEAVRITPLFRGIHAHNIALLKRA